MFRVILYGMRKSHIFVFGGILLLGVGFFALYSRWSGTFFVRSEAVRKGEIVSEEPRQGVVPAPLETASSGEESIDVGVFPKENTVVAEEKAIKQDSTAKEAEKEVAPKVVEESKAAPKLSGVQSKLVGFGFSVPSKPRSIDTIILHSSYNSLGGDPYSVDKIVDIYESYGVAAHYLIDRSGTIYQLVKDENIAYHAGVSQVPDGRKNVNDFSIGVEIINTLDGKYTDEQYAAVRKLIASLKGKYEIQYVLGHDDIAPGRKTDPWNFDWKKL